MAREPMPPGLYDMVVERDGGRCVRCEALWHPHGFSVHHRRARGMGGRRGAHTAANLILICGSGSSGCHGWVESHREEGYDTGYLVRSGQDPADVPVLRGAATGRPWLEHPRDGYWLAA